MKKDYLDKVGEIVRRKYKFDLTASFVLMDIRFPDGALFCVEPEQVRILEE